MFLALKEMKHSKLRFSLIIVMIVLVSYLIFVLTALAYGLSESNRQAVDSWQAQAIVLNSDADGGLAQSTLSKDQASALTEDGTAAQIGQLGATISKNSGADKTSTQILGIKSDEFIYRQLLLSSGEKGSGDHDAIADASLQEDGYTLGDTISVGSTDTTLTITGFTTNAKLSVAPVIYVPLSTWQDLKFGSDANDSSTSSAAASTPEANAARQANEPAASAVVFKNSTLSDTPPDGTEQLSIDDFIEKLPGYRAQNLTFEFMIVFLFIITLVIVAVFLYILTMQKIPSFAVLKVQGILTRYLVWNTMMQAVLITAVGVAVGSGLTALTAAFIPPSVPMSFNVPLLAGAGALLLLMSVIGSLASVRTIARIDPVVILGGN